MRKKIKNSLDRILVQIESAQELRECVKYLEQNNDKRFLPTEKYPVGPDKTISDLQKHVDDLRAKKIIDDRQSANLTQAINALMFYFVSQKENDIDIRNRFQIPLVTFINFVSTIPFQNTSLRKIRNLGPVGLKNLQEFLEQSIEIKEN